MSLVVSIAELVLAIQSMLSQAFFCIYLLMMDFRVQIPTGPFIAIALAVRSSSSSSFYLFGSTLETNPISFASVDFMSLPVNASSLKVDSLPIMFGMICSVPKSAAIPMSIYLIVNSASLVQYRISHMEIKSTPPPIHFPCTPTTTGTLHSIIDRNCCCISFIASYSFFERRAGSSFSGSKAKRVENSFRSRPAVKRRAELIKIATLTSSCLLIASNTSFSSLKKVVFIAFKALGRLIITFTIFPSSRYST